MAKKKYTEKRNFSKTPEPKSGGKRGTQKLFVIQKHHAKRLHYDLRLQHGKTLKSWAVPKGIPKTTKEKHLAIQVEDHPIAYAEFEGTIPQGEYGAGKVEIWDKGSYSNIKKDSKEKVVPFSKCLEMGQIEIYFSGKRLKGPFALVHFKEDNWLLIKMKEKNE